MTTQIRKTQSGNTITRATGSQPTVNDDVSLGYNVGSIWFDTLNKTLFICTSPLLGAAVWSEAAVYVDGTTITGDGTNANPLVATQPIVEQKTSVGGAATEVFTVTGAGVGDKVFLQLVNDGTNNVSILSGNITGVNQLTVVFSADPLNDTVFNVLVFP